MLENYWYYLAKIFMFHRGSPLAPARSRTGNFWMRQQCNHYPAVLQCWFFGSGIWWFGFFPSFFFLTVIFLMLVSWLQAKEGGAVTENSWRKSSPRRGRSSQTGSRKKTKGSRGGAGKGRTAAPTGRRERTERERRAGARSETSMLPSWNFCASWVGSEVDEATSLMQHLD